MADYANLNQPNWAPPSSLFGPVWSALYLLMAAFWKIHHLAAVMMLPYLGWIVFAAALNYSVWALNS